MLLITNTITSFYVPSDVYRRTGAIGNKISVTPSPRKLYNFLNQNRHENFVTKPASKPNFLFCLALSKRFVKKYMPVFDFVQQSTNYKIQIFIILVISPLYF